MREEILAVLQKTLPNIDFMQSEHLVDDKVLDSLSIVSLVSELSIAFDIEFDLSDIDVNVFNSLDSIVQTVAKLQSEKK